MKKKIVFVLAVIASFVGLLFLVSNKVRVKATECESQYGACSSQIQEMVEGYAGESYFNAKKMLAEELSHNSRVEYYRIRFDLPDEMVVAVVEKKPEIALKFADDKYFLFDREANVVAETAETQLPHLAVTKLPSESSLRFGVKLFRELFRYYEVFEGKIDNVGLYVKIRGANVVFPLSGDVDVLFGAAEVALLQLPKLSENSTINSPAGIIYTVDLRYKNPVISQNE